MVQSQYAVIKTGGKQYRVKVGQRFRFELIPGEPGDPVVFNEVLLRAEGEQIEVGAPFLPAARVEATILQHGRGDKVTIIKMRRRKGYRRKQGHRQNFTEIEITKIH